MKKAFFISVLSVVFIFSFSAFCACSSNGKGNADSQIDYGTLTVENVDTYKGYFVQANPVFSTVSEPVTYACESENALSFSGNKITGNEVGTYTVTATTDHLSTTFTVNVKDPNASESSNIRLYENDFETYLATLQQNLDNFNHDEGELALYIGDSFFDTRYFFTDFYDRFAGKNAFSFGISASKAYQWTWYVQKVAQYNPKALIIHIGTNDIFDWWHSEKVVTKNLKNMFETIHDLMPETEVYWYTIELRRGSSVSTRNEKVKTVNSNIISYSADKSWLTVLDSITATTYEDGTIREYLYRDDVHLTCPEGYNLLTDLLYESGFEFTNNSKIA